MSYSHFEIKQRGSSAIAHLRSPLRNVVNWSFYQELPVLLRDLENNANVKSVILIGSGLDLAIAAKRRLATRDAFFAYIDKDFFCFLVLKGSDHVE